MQDKDVIISIKGAQRFDDMEAEQIELVTAGKYSWAPEGCTFSYQEGPGAGLPMTKTTFSVEEKGRRILLTRQGAVNSQMLFEEGKRHLSIYETAEGRLTIGLGVHRVNTRLGEKGGSIEVDYSIEIDHALAGENRFRISIREPAKATSYTTRLS